MPKKSSRGRPVSAQVGKGAYWRWPEASVIWMKVGQRVESTN